MTTTTSLCAGDDCFGLRMRALIVLLWRASLRISEALALAESDLDALHGSVLVRRGKGGTGQFRASSNKAVSDPRLSTRACNCPRSGFVPELPGSSWNFGGNVPAG